MGICGYLACAGVLVVLIGGVVNALSSIDELSVVNHTKFFSLRSIYVF